MIVPSITINWHEFLCLELKVAMQAVKLQNCKIVRTLTIVLNSRFFSNLCNIEILPIHLCLLILEMRTWTQASLPNQNGHKIKLLITLL